MNTLGFPTNAHLIPLTAPSAGRPLRDANLLWSRAGRLMLPKELRLRTPLQSPERVFPRPHFQTFGGQATSRRSMAPRQCCSKHQTDTLNDSTLGLFSLLMRRQETSGAWVKFQKTWWEELPVPSKGILEGKESTALDSLWAQVADKPLLPFPQMSRDPVTALIDEAVAKALGVPDFAEFPALIAREPVMSG